MISASEQTMSHQWGSYPANSIEQYVEDIAQTVGPYLAFGLSDAEIDVPGYERKDWAVDRLKRLEALHSIKVLRHGEYANYADISVLDIHDALDPRELQLGYFDIAKQSLPQLREAMRDRELAHLPMQVGILGDMEIPSLAFGAKKIADDFDRYARPFVQAGDMELTRLTSDLELQEQGLAIQFECPVETLAALASARDGKDSSSSLASTIVRQVAVLPQNALTALHFCYGRHNGKPLDAPDSHQENAYAPVVELINQTLSMWPEGHDKPKIVGMPIIAEGGHMPTDRAIKNIVAQLQDLKMPSETMLAPGTATFYTEIPDLVRLNGRIQDGIGKPVAISSPCGKSSLRTRLRAARLVMGREAVAIRQLRASASAAM